MKNIKKHKLLELKTSKLVDSLFIWNYKTKHKWRGIEFVDYKEYWPEDNVKNIDFIRSANEWKTLVKLYEEERELSVYFILDLNENISSENIYNNKMDIFYELYYLIWLSAIKQWDKVGAFIFNESLKKLHYAKKWKQNFINIIKDIELIWSNNFANSFFSNIKTLFSRNKKTNSMINSWLNYFNSLKIKNSLVFYFTDKLDIEKKQLEILSLKNDFIFCNIFNSFENNLEWKWISWLSNWNESLFIDLDNIEKKEKYIKLRKEKINNFKKTIRKTGSMYLLLDETKNVYKEIYKLFQK